MNTTRKTKFFRYVGVISAVLFTPMIFYQFQQGHSIEVLKTLGFLLGSVAFAMQPQAFVTLPDDARTTMAPLSTMQKILFLAAIFLALLLPFLSFYIIGFIEIM